MFKIFFLGCVRCALCCANGIVPIYINTIKILIVFCCCFWCAFPDVYQTLRFSASRTDGYGPEEAVSLEPPRGSKIVVKEVPGELRILFPPPSLSLELLGLFQLSLPSVLDGGRAIYIYIYIFICIYIYMYWYLNIGKVIRGFP